MLQRRPRPGLLVAGGVALGALLLGTAFVVQLSTTGTESAAPSLTQAPTSAPSSAALSAPSPSSPAPGPLAPTDQASTPASAAAATITAAGLSASPARARAAGSPGSTPSPRRTSATASRTSGGAGSPAAAAPAGTKPSGGAGTTTPAPVSPRTSGGAVSAPPIATTTRTGVATYYGKAAAGGACMSLTVPSSRYTVAANPKDFAGSASCGSWVRITGRRGTILAKVDNLCPECEPGHLDLSDEAFAALDDPSVGITPITYSGVQDPAVERGLTFKVKDGSSRWWLGLHVDDNGNPLAAVEVADGSGDFRAMTRSTTGFWTIDNPGNGPFRVRLRDVYGHGVVVPGIALTVGALQQTAARLY